MREEAELLHKVINKLTQVRLQLGEEVFKEAAKNAMLGIARSVLNAANRRVRRDKSACEIIAFDIGRMKKSTDLPDT